ncbi:MAG: zinc ABC transporter substrate-binding protein [Enterobacterales bacterium]|nr:zinc ABC transporter substrate-binding protein [Enterobacterales bacterium]
MNSIIKSILFVLALIAFPAIASINLFTCEPEWKSLADEIGGDQIHSFSATSGLQDPHHIQARPSLIAQVRKADMFICTGADLEIGWLPLLLRRAGNSQLQKGQKGYFMATRYVRILGKPKMIDRSQGDVHAAGNPHIQTNPKNILPVAKALAKRFIEIDPQNASLYQSRLDDFAIRWKAALKRWKKMTRPLKHLPIVVHHASWIYLEDYLKMQQLATLEDKPGIPPTSGHLVSILKHMKVRPAKVIIHAAYQSGKPAQWLADKTQIPAVKLPFTVGGTEAAKDLFGLYDDTFKRLLETVKP